ncbi:MAG: SulP family inorganic anion transporter [Saprospiraceae bacterium]
MPLTSSHEIPFDWFKGLAQNWRNDLIAAVSVSLVAMPLALGIAVASGVPPMSGVLSAIIGGVVTTIIRGSHLTINGPTAGLIASVLAALAALDDGSGRALNYVLAAIVVAGGIQTLMGLFKWGKFAEFFPSSVIHGILAAIGVIIIAKQTHVALGTVPDPGNTIEVLKDIFRKIGTLNPVVTAISLFGLLLLIFHARISYKLFHMLPAPMWVLFLSIPFVYFFDFFHPHFVHFFGHDYSVGPQYLIEIPDNPLDCLIYPDFSKIHTGPFWLAVISITLIASVETLASTKAVDKLDPYKRQTDLNRDLIGVGMSTMISGALGGLPIISVIIRSTVNIHNNARTRWSNFFHGVLLILFIVLMAPLIQMVPLAALAIILVFTGFKLASPRVFAHAYEQGMEQLLFLSGTLIITLYTNLLGGIIGGTILTLTVHILLARVPVTSFFKMVFHSGTRMVNKGDGNYEIRIKALSIFCLS